MRSTLGALEAALALAQQFKPFVSGIGGLDRQAGNVPARSRQAGDVAVPHGVVCQRKDDRNDRCRLLRGGGGASRCDHDIYFQPDHPPPHPPHTSPPPPPPTLI